MPHYFDERAGGASGRGDGRRRRSATPSFTLRTDRGVFSHGRLDAGTALLLRQAPAPPADGRRCSTSAAAPARSP